MRRFYFLILLTGLLFSCVSCQERNTNEVNVDLVFPLTGNGATASEATVDAINLCIDKWNESGGVNGCKINVTRHDSKGQTKEAINIARKITIGNRTDIVVSAMSSVSLGMLPILEEHRITHLAFSGANSLLENNPQFVVRGSISPKQIGNAVVKNMSARFEGKELVIFYCNNEFGKGYLDATLKAAGVLEQSAIKSVAYDEAELSFRNIILKSSLQENNLVFVIGQQESLGRLVKQIRESGYGGVILSEPNITSASTLAILNKELLDNVFYIAVTHGGNIEDVKKAYFAKYKKEASDLALDAYNNIDLILNLYKHGGANDAVSAFNSLDDFLFDGLFGPTRIVDHEIEYNLQLKECINLLK